MDKAASIFIDVFTKNPLTVTLAVLGVICVGLAIIGRIPPMDIMGVRAILLGAFGFTLIVVSIGLAWLLTPSSASVATQPQSVPVVVATVPQPSSQPTFTLYTIPTVAQQQTARPAITPVVATTQSTARFHFISLQGLGTPESGNLGVQAGTRNLANVDFEIGWLATTHSEGDPDSPKTIAVNVQPSIPNVSKVYFLLQASWGVGPSKEFGSILLFFADGRTIREPLTLAYNIRDWSDVNRPLTALNAQQAWQGVGWDGRTKGVVDMLTINVPSDYRQTQLVRVEVRDESLEKLNSPDPGIHLWAITAE
jgi:hypothetical protein